MKKQTLYRNQCVFPYADFVMQVNQFSWNSIRFPELISLIVTCDKSNNPLLYSLIKEVIFRCNGLTLFDTQISAAYSMACGNVAELPTGEGKTLAAVLAATCLALQGRKVHILTFNDYLSKRDYMLNKNIFEICNLTSGFIQETSAFEQRKQAYVCHITYASAKQVGFDYLKNFLCNEPHELLPIDFDVALVDEADSILIDEARIPLVVAGDAKSEVVQISKIDDIIKHMKPEGMVCNLLDGTFWLTDSGISYIEDVLHLQNLFNEENADTLTLINAAIEARYLLAKDKDYLVKENQVLVIDETTGRIALTRKFPTALHQAVEIKENLNVHNQTVIYNSMPLQFFLLKYQFLCGMTGTASASAKELKSMYGLSVDIIPPHVPCIRKEHADCICNTEKEKANQILLQIMKSHSKSQPILLGTQSVKESEQYSELLSANKLPHKVLNARNDEEEAQIITNAGRPYEITISTNMAGRGVDIRLGGQFEEEKNFVEKAGGLFVIGCGMNKSPRIDRQLIGRSGRQGDPGESIFFISKEDSLIFKYLGDSKLKPQKLKSQIRCVQKYEDGQAAEARYMLSKYAYLLELQRQRITKYRDEILHSTRHSDFLRKEAPALFTQYVDTVGIEGVRRAERQLTLYFINQHWADYLCTMENIRSGIHLCIIGGLNPIDEYHKTGVSAFSDMEEDIRNDVLSHMKSCKITASGIDLEKAGLIGATSTYTYMIDESKSQFIRLPHLLSNLSNGMNGVLFSIPRLFLSAIMYIKNKFA